MKINLLDSSLGIQNVLDRNTEKNLPGAENMAASVLYEAGLEDLYAPENYARIIEESLSPHAGDGQILRPAAFSHALDQCIEKMGESENELVKRTVQEELLPLQENKALLQVYCGLMIGG